MLLGGKKCLFNTFFFYLQSFQWSSLALQHNASDGILRSGLIFVGLQIFQETKNRLVRPVLRK